MPRLTGCVPLNFRDTYVERQPGETANDRNDRAIRTAALWYKKHLNLNQDPHDKGSVQLVLLTNDRENANKAKATGITTYTSGFIRHCLASTNFTFGTPVLRDSSVLILLVAFVSVYEYVRSLDNASELVDRLASEEDSSVSSIWLSYGPVVSHTKPFSGNVTIVSLFQSFRSNKPVYPEHLPLSEIQQGLKSGRLHQGSFQTSRDNYMEGLVSVSDMDDRVGLGTLPNDHHSCVRESTVNVATFVLRF